MVLKPRTGWRAWIRNFTLLDLVLSFQIELRFRKSYAQAGKAMKQIQYE